MSDDDAFGVGLSFPLSNSTSKYGPVIKGAVLLFLSFLIVPLFTLFGYALRLREHAARGEDEAPMLNDWGELTVEGLFGSVAFLPLIVAAIAAALVGAGLTGVNESLGSTVTTLGVFAIYYVLPGYLTAYAVKRDISDTYTDPTVRETVMSREYAIAYLKYLPFTLVLYVLVNIGSVVVIPAFFLVPYAMYARHSYWGAAYRNIAAKN